MYDWNGNPEAFHNVCVAFVSIERNSESYRFVLRGLACFEDYRLTVTLVYSSAASYRTCITDLPASDRKKLFNSLPEL